MLSTVNMNNSVAINLTGAAGDVDGDPIIFTLPPNPVKYGNITRTGNGLYVYEANPGVSNENLQDVFAYSVLDGRGGNASSEVTVTIGEHFNPLDGKLRLLPP